MSEQIKSEWSGNEEELKRLHEIVTEVHKAMTRMREDATLQPRFVDGCRQIYSLTKPLLTSGDNEKLYEAKRKNVERMLDECEATAELEARRAKQKVFNHPDLFAVGSSKTALKNSQALIDELNVLRQRMGMGMNVKRIISLDTEASISKA